MAQLLEQNQGYYTWDNLLKPLQDMDDRLSRAWSPVSHLNSVKNSEPLRAAHEHCLPLLSEYHTELGQNSELYKAIKFIADSEEFNSLSAAQKKIIENSLRDFHLSGIDLDTAKQQRYKEIRQQLSKLRSSYENNVLDATNAWSRHINDPQLLAGLPDSALAMAKQTAEHEDKDGWVFNLQFPSYFAIVTHADNWAVRQEFYNRIQHPCFRSGAR